MSKKNFQRLYGHEFLSKKFGNSVRILWNPEGFKSRLFTVVLKKLPSGNILVISKQNAAPVQAQRVLPGYSVRFTGRDLDGVVKGEFFNV